MLLYWIGCTHKPRPMGDSGGRLQVHTAGDTCTAFCSFQTPKPYELDLRIETRRRILLVASQFRCVHDNKRRRRRRRRRRHARPLPSDFFCSCSRWAQGRTSRSKQVRTKGVCLWLCQNKQKSNTRPSWHVFFACVHGYALLHFPSTHVYQPLVYLT